jgi:hypothetical protein
MIALALIAALLAQESPVPRLVAKIDEAKSKESFQALMALAALPPEHRKETEAAAEKLPAFYREALASELKIRDLLKEKYGRIRRITIREDEIESLELLDRIAQKTGLDLSAGSSVSRRPQPKFSFDVSDATPIEALAEFCSIARVKPQYWGYGPIVLEQLSWSCEPFGAGHFAAISRMVTVRERVDFSAPPERTLRLEFDLIWDPTTCVATVAKDVRLVEALTDTGVRLEKSTRKPVTTIREMDRWHAYVNRNLNREVELHLKTDDASPSKIDRLRIVAATSVATREKVYSVRDEKNADKTKAADDEFELTMEKSPSVEPDSRKFECFVKPLKMKPADLMTLPVRFDARYPKGGEGRTYMNPRLRGDGVVYEVVWYPLGYLSPAGRMAAQEPDIVKVTIPLDLVERPLYMEFKDVPIR